MINRFKKYIRENKLIQSGDSILLAVSGGIDSVVMLDLFDKAGINYAIAHCNFKLRDNESDEDEMFVRQLAHNYDVDIFVTVCKAADYAKTNGLSIQESARDLRYSWFNKVCLHNNYSLVAVGHNQDDNIETFFINLFRGAGIKGLKGIPVKRNNIIRPLLFATRSEIIVYAKDNNITFREDSSNSSDYYLRNKIRHHLIPKIEDISPGFANTAKKSIDNLVEADLLLESVIKDKKEQLFVINSDSTVQISISEIRNLIPTSVWMYYLLSGFGFIRQITDAICISIESSDKIGSRFSSTDYELLIDRDNLIIRSKENKTPRERINITSVQSELTHPMKMVMENKVNTSNFIFNNSKKIAYFNMDKLSFPLTMRPWEVGDRIIPFGMSGSKLVSDILIDHKVNTFEKENTFVLISNKKIIWVIGYRTSNEFRVKKSTKDIYVISLII
ncbi:MAG: tRNA lysidine(34) synthetase TilS [Bacteroidota bacterium]